MFRKILYPTDFSEGAKRALQRFSQTNRMEIGECVILHVIDSDLLEDFMQGYSLAYQKEEREIKEIEEKLKNEVKKKMDEVKNFCEELLHPAKIKTIIRIGTPHEEIMKVADEEDVSLILMPSHGKMVFSHEFIGSTTMRVLKKTKRAVLIIKTHREE